jgi:hypothetical protein
MHVIQAGMHVIRVCTHAIRVCMHAVRVRRPRKMHMGMHSSAHV